MTISFRKKPQNYFNFHSVAYWIQRIMELYSRLKSKSRSETRLTYLEQIKSSPFWLSHQFNVIVQNIFKKCTKFNTKEKFPKDCIMAIKPSNIMIFDASKVNKSLIRMKQKLLIILK